MPVTPHVVALLLFCGARSWPVFRPWSSGDNDGSDGKSGDDTPGYYNRTSRGMFFFSLQELRHFLFQ
jgi:hypothetical protein